MESVLIMDCDRLKELKVLCTFEMKAGKRELDKENAFRFIFFAPQGPLVIGPVGDHGDLFALYQSWDLPTPEVAQYTKKFEDSGGAYARQRSRSPIQGAGRISSDGRVTNWTSGGFDIATPSNMREEIEREIVKLYQSGALAIL